MNTGGGKEVRTAGPIFAVASLLLSLGATACGDNEPAQETDAAATTAATEIPEATMATTFAPELNVDLAQMEQPSAGLYRKEITVGEGAFATPGDIVNVHYTGWLSTGKQFDSSRGKSPYRFELGAGDVIEGWDQGVAGMREGGKRQLVIPPDLGYGAAGAGMGVIPPNATLVFEVELMSVE